MEFLIYALQAVLVIFGFKRLKFILKFFQQESYFNDRLFRFAINKMQLFDKFVSLPLLALSFFHNILAIVAAIAIVIRGIIVEKNPMKASIKPLVMTGRAKRIFYTAWILFIALILSTNDLSKLSLVVLFAPALIMIANIFMSPIENFINQRFINEAKAKLKKYNPVVIGVTGSFGKTSLKNILQHILSSYSSSFATKRSINTLMGIVRVIREEMNEPYKYFVAEIGIGDKGQMPALLKFVNPNYGILTAVGAAHLANFKNIETTAKEKFRLSKAVAKNGGKTILAANNIDKKFIDQYKNPNDIIFDGNGIENIKQTIDGLSFTFNYNGEKSDIFAPIYGIHQAQNIALAFIMARMLGASADSIVLALKTLKQTEHRLELKREGNLTILDDSFNSNVNGFLSALETGNAVKGQNRFILITPGMVELGDMHAAQHKLVGKLADKVCDVVIAVNPDRIKDFTDEISKKKLVKAESLKTAREWLTANGQNGDIVLFENDLPDVHIEKISI